MEVIMGEPVWISDRAKWETAPRPQTTRGFSKASDLLSSFYLLFFSNQNQNLLTKYENTYKQGFIVIFPLTVLLYN